MSEPILDSFRHNAWATRVLLRFCKDLKPEQMQTAAGGGYGSIAETFKHLLTAESYYTAMFTGSFPDWRVEADVTPPLAEMEQWALDVASIWESILSGPVDGDALLTRKRRDGGVTEVRAGAMLAQALHHSNVHREQISASLTVGGIEPPDISGWGYGRASGRISSPGAN
jgi:uncharacterized damage-inducible protein DinB